MTEAPDTAADFAGEDFDPATGARDMTSADTGARDVIDLGEREAAPAPVLPEGEMSALTGKIVDQLKTVYDPEIPVDIYELGLIYKVDYDPPQDGEGGTAKVQMTLTAPGCPVAGEMPGWVENALLVLKEIDAVEVEMTFDPPWNPERMSDEAKLELGWM